MEAIRRPKFTGSGLEVGACAAAIAVAWLFSFLTRTVPFASGDQGIFQSVAYRILAGDRLYTDVYDNKDPLFYFLLVGEAWAGPLFQYLGETLPIAGTAFLIAITARRFAAGMTLAQCTGIALAAAYIFTGWFWGPGMPGTPGTFFAMGAIAAALFERPVIAGLALAVTLFTNIIFFPPVAGSVLVFNLLLSVRGLSVTRSLWLTIIAGAAGVAVVVILLIATDTWPGYLAMLARNSTYTQQNWVVSRDCLRRCGTTSKRRSISASSACPCGSPASLCCCISGGSPQRTRFTAQPAWLERRWSRC